MQEIKKIYTRGRPFFVSNKTVPFHIGRFPLSMIFSNFWRTALNMCCPIERMQVASLRTQQNCSASFRPPNIGVGDRGAGGAAALPTLEKFAKISHNRAENRPKIGQNFSKQWIFYRAAPLNFISPYAHASQDGNTC